MPESAYYKVSKIKTHLCILTQSLAFTIREIMHTITKLLWIVIVHALDTLRDIFDTEQKRFHGFCSQYWKIQSDFQNIFMVGLTFAYSVCRKLKGFLRLFVPYLMASNQAAQQFNTLIVGITASLGAPANPNFHTNQMLMDTTQEIAICFPEGPKALLLLVLLKKQQQCDTVAIRSGVSTKKKG